MRRIVDRFSLRFVVNGEAHEILADTRETLLDVLRDRLGLTGAKNVCDLQVCGACTVILNGHAVSACSVLAVDARSSTVLTIEGVSSRGRLDPVQQAFVDHNATQCGYCTPGMIMMVKALLAEDADPSADEIRAYLVGNLCRCTGYQKIVEAVLTCTSRSRSKTS